MKVLDIEKVTALHLAWQNVDKDDPEALDRLFHRPEHYETAKALMIDALLELFKQRSFDGAMEPEKRMAGVPFREFLGELRLRSLATMAGFLQMKPPAITQQ